MVFDRHRLDDRQRISRERVTITQWAEPEPARASCAHLTKSRLMGFGTVRSAQPGATLALMLDIPRNMRAR